MTSIEDLSIRDAKQAIARGREFEKQLGNFMTSDAPCAGIREGANAGNSEGLNIVILERGHVFVGDVSISGNWVIISNAKNVRRWGTSHGLGELALNGPQPETKLDMGGTIKSPLSALIGLLKCEPSSWKK